jgi:hypothetical protein
MNTIFWSLQQKQPLYSIHHKKIRRVGGTKETMKMNNLQLQDDGTTRIDPL